jgi:hypothetical protein
MGKFRESRRLLGAQWPGRIVRRWRVASAVTLVIAASVVTVAVADIVTVNDVVTGGDATKAVGDTGTARFVLRNTNGDGGANGCNTGGGNPITFNVTSSQPTKVSLASSSIVFSGCDDPATPAFENAQTVGYTALNAGSSVISASYASGGKTGTQTPSAYDTTDTLTVTVTPPPDTT